jgi:hypothetical protein
MSLEFPILCTSGTVISQLNYIQEFHKPYFLLQLLPFWSDRKCRHSLPHFKPTNTDHITDVTNGYKSLQITPTDHLSYIHILFSIKNLWIYENGLSSSPSALCSTNLETYYSIMAVAPRILIMSINLNLRLKTKLNSMVWVREPPLVGEVIANFLRIEGATWSAWRIPTAIFSTI